MTQLVIDENCVRKSQIKRKFFNFMLRCLFMHNGPILKFSVSFKYLDECPDMDQCLRFLSRKNIKELVLDKVSPEPTLATPAVFSCQQLISLTIKSFGMKLPRTFQGFPCLKYLHLEYNILTGEVVENLIAGCPLLEKFEFVNFECGEFTVRAPNLKHLFLDVNFTHIYLEHAPLLAAITIEIDTEFAEGKPLITVPVTYHCLKFIQLNGVLFQEKNEVVYVHHLLLQTPNVQELRISAVAIEDAFFEEADMDFWEKEIAADFLFKHLKIVKMSCVSSEKDMQFIKFVLRCSPVLELMSVSYYIEDGTNMNIENAVLHFPRASPGVDIKFSVMPIPPIVF
nr:PREDICTED: F-box/FBD/LRR-repeat protein At1g13570-like [Daucus carota subsp. sativus]